MITSFLASFFSDLEEELRKAGIKEDIFSYAKKAEIYIFAVMIAMGFAGFILGTLISLIIFKTIILIIPIPLSIFFSIIGFLIGIIYFRSLPSIKASERKRKIDAVLYYVTTYMASLASSGSNPLTLFELLSKYKEFSEIQKDAKEIYDLVTSMGVSLPMALHYKAQYTPSRDWREILEGIRSILIEGGSLDEFLYRKARQLAEEYKRNLVEYSNTMQVLLEVYITLVVVGVIFVIILTTLMASITSATEFIYGMQLFSSAVILPLATIMFVFILKSINPIEE